LGRSRIILQDKYEHSGELGGSRSNTVPYSASETIGEMGVTPGNQFEILPASGSDKRDGRKLIIVNFNLI
jgi:hypothetical protein